MVGQLFAHGGLELLLELEHVSGSAGPGGVVRVTCRCEYAEVFVSSFAARLA